MAQITIRGLNDYNSTDALSILSQALLSNDANIVDTAANLLCQLIIKDETACSKLYLTGVFSFVLQYTGSNFQSLSRLLDETHLNQNFLSGSIAAAAKQLDESDDGISVQQRRI